jgi:hypothetical protein
VRAGYSSRTAAVRKRRSHAFPEVSPVIDLPRLAGPLMPAKKAVRVAVLKNTRISKASTFDARAREQGGSRP